MTMCSHVRIDEAAVEDVHPTGATSKYLNVYSALFLCVCPVLVSCEGVEFPSVSAVENS